MLLSKLLDKVKVKQIVGNANLIRINSISDNSLEKQDNGLFFAIKGLTVDGHNYVQEAIENGATTIVCEKALSVNCVQIIVKDVREVVCKIASNFYGNPSEKMKMIAVTGTNGKTSTSFILDKIFSVTGFKTGLIGTSGSFINGKNLESRLTTPDPIELNKILAKMLKEKVEIVFMEVSAHAIALNKIKGLVFDVGIFTNLTQDHLDFFKTIKKYGEIKKSLFTLEYVKCAVVNVDDETGKDLFVNSKVPTYTYGIKNPADAFAINIGMDFSGSSFFVNLMDKTSEIKTNLCGKFNIYNCLAAALTSKVLGLTLNQIVNGLEKVQPINGRFNIIKNEGRNIIIDYAHTPDALKGILTSVKELTKGRIICVFGSAGNREQEKREVMGEIVGDLAEVVIITSDNPALENPNIIAKQIEKGVKKVNKNYFLIEDRFEAIKLGLIASKEADSIVICGKGNEDYQDINSVKVPYSDKDAVLKILKEINQKIKRGF